MPEERTDAVLGTAHVCGIVRYASADQAEERHGPACEWRGGLAYMRGVPLLIDFEAVDSFIPHIEFVQHGRLAAALLDSYRATKTKPTTWDAKQHN